jgi:alpha-glucosidase
LPQPATWASLSAVVQRGDPRSTLTLYRDALRLRKELVDDSMTWLDSTPDVLAFRRGQDFTCIVNFGDTPVPARSLGVHGEVVLASDARHRELALVPADIAVWVRGTHRATFS